MRKTSKEEEKTVPSASGTHVALTDVEVDTAQRRALHHLSSPLKTHSPPLPSPHTQTHFFFFGGVGSGGWGVLWRFSYVARCPS